MTQVSGPVNLIRLEGKINNVDKVFYVFMDYHIQSTMQTECTDVRSVHIKNYLVNTLDSMKNIPKTFDFFLESFPDMITFQTKQTDIYINQLRDMFERIFKFNFETNKVIKPVDFPNLRLHYIDIRPYFTFKAGNPFGMKDMLGNFIFSNECNPFYNEDIFKIQDYLLIIISEINLINKICFEKLDNVKHINTIRKYVNKFVSYDKTEANNNIKYLINKIKNVYEKSEVKKKINELFNSQLENIFSKLFDQYDGLIKEIESAKVKLNHDFYDKVYENEKVTFFGASHENIHFDIMKSLIPKYLEFGGSITHMYITFMDLYFLRRSLDKDYVTNVLVYTGAYHSANYIKFLVNTFDFKVTHVSYSQIKDMKQLNKKLHTLNNTEKVLDIFIPNKLHQCIDVSNFPKNFA
jgi:hypothetical protein